jgi:hypothetical protein
MAVSMGALNTATARSLAAAESNVLTRDAMLDPVTKLRVSMPQALIDTDFEYGPHASKWETFESNMEFPTFYKNDGDAGIKITIVQAWFTTTGMWARTSTDHGLRAGDVIIIQGTKAPTAMDGQMTVMYVPNNREFTFIGKAPLGTYNQVTSNCVLYKARAYSHSLPQITSITTDGASPYSTLTITSSSPNCFAVNQPVTLRNTIGYKAIDFDVATAISGAFLVVENHNLCYTQVVTYIAAAGSANITNLVSGASYRIQRTALMAGNSFRITSVGNNTNINISKGTATGIHTFLAKPAGSLDGTYTITAELSPTQWQILLPFRAPKRDLDFAPANALLTTSISGAPATHRFNIPNHGLTSGNLLYSKLASTSAIAGLTDATSYAFTYIDTNNFALTGLTLTSADTTNHRFTSDVVSGNKMLTSLATVSSSASDVSADDANFISSLKMYDNVKMDADSAPVVFPRVNISSIAGNVITFSGPHGFSTGMIAKYTHFNPLSVKSPYGLSFGADGYISTWGDSTLYAKYGTNTFTIEYNDKLYRLNFNNSVTAGGRRGYTLKKMDGTTSTTGTEVPRDFIIVVYDMLSGHVEQCPEMVNDGLYFVRAVTADTVTLHTTAANAVANTNITTITSGPRGLGGGRLEQNDIHVISGTNSADSTYTVYDAALNTAAWYATSTSGTYAVRYLTMPGETAIAGLVSGNVYYARVPSGTSRFSLHATNADAVGNVNKIYNTTVAGYVVGTNEVYTLNSTVSEIGTPTFMKIADLHTFSSVNTRIWTTTNAFTPGNGAVVHRPFDGGVEVIPSMTSGSKITRQTRRYFRYQSGKGIQISSGVNFSGWFDIMTFTSTGSISARAAHNLTSGTAITVAGCSVAAWNGTYTVTSVTSSTAFTVTPPAGVSGNAPGFVKYTVNAWSGASVRCGLFDDQNGLFYEYDGSVLWAVRRSSTQILAGTISATRLSKNIGGTGTKFLSQLSVGTYIVIKGLTYRVAEISSDTAIVIQPPYRGQTDISGSMVAAVVQNVRVPQSSWSLDKCDGTGPSGYNLDIHKMQMVYIDYSWYGAGKARFGFKGVDGNVFYAHEFLHNNMMDEAYMRSGNLPARYEVLSGTAPTYVPRIMHWGTSVIMDGKMDEDRAFFFTTSGKTLVYGNGDSYDFQAAYTNATGSFKLDTSTGTSVYAYQMSVASYDAVKTLRPGNILTSTIFTTAARLISVTKSGTAAIIYVDTAPNVATGSTLYTISATSPQSSIPTVIPLVSFRNAPCADSGLSGDVVGSREVINRMQLVPLSIDILSTHDADITMYLNGYPSNKTWTRASNPSLSQVLLHDGTDSLAGGSVVFSFRVEGGAPDSTGKRSSAKTTVSLANLSTVGNSICGGDDVFPDGPDVLTVAASLLDASGITSTTPFSISARLSWTESQA